jgi:hypothetical protein
MTDTYPLDMDGYLDIIKLIRDWISWNLSLGTILAASIYTGLINADMNSPLR